MSGPNDVCFEAGAQCLAQRLLAGGGDAHLVKLSPIKTEAGHTNIRNLSDAGATSGHSDTTYHTLLPSSATAAAADGHASPLAVLAREPASPDSVVTAPKPSQAAAGSPASAAPQVPDLVPLPPPDVSEGPEAAAEYELYLQRWDAGHTLAQRWHRLAQQGKLCDIQEEWEDWQLDLMLTQVKQRSQAAQAQQRSGAVTPSNGPGSRPRRGRADVEDAADSQVDEPRRVRSRRAPSTLQDYHVENAPSRTPDRQDADAAAAAAAAAGAGGAQQGATDVSDDSTDEAPAGITPALLQQQYQQQAPRPGNMRGSLQHQHMHMAQQQPPPRRPTSRLQRPTPSQHQLLQQHQQQPYPVAVAPSQFNRVAAPYSPRMFQQQMQAQQGQQQIARAAPQQYQQQQVQAQQGQQQQMAFTVQQLMTQLQQNAGGQPALQQQQQVPPEAKELWFKIGSALGSMIQEGGGPATLLTNPQAMCAIVEAALKHQGDPDALIQQLAATMNKGLM